MIIVDIGVLANDPQAALDWCVPQPSSDEAPQGEELVASKSYMRDACGEEKRNYRLSVDASSGGGGLKKRSDPPRDVFKEKFVKLLVIGEKRDNYNAQVLHHTNEQARLEAWIANYGRMAELAPTEEEKAALRLRQHTAMQQLCTSRTPRATAASYLCGRCAGHRSR